MRDGPAKPHGSLWFLCSATVFAAATLSVGCSRDSRISVQGLVEINGARVAEGIISFWPADGRGVSVQASIEDGRYQTPLPPGKKIVGIESFVDAGERPIMGDSGPRLRVREGILPELFADQRRSPLRCLVDERSQTHDFILTTDREP